MNDKNIKQLIELAKKLKKEISKERAMATFVSAGILTIEGEFTKPYNKLNEVFTDSPD